MNKLIEHDYFVILELPSGNKTIGQYLTQEYIDIIGNDFGILVKDLKKRNIKIIAEFDLADLAEVTWRKQNE